MKRSQPIQRKTELRASGRPERKARKTVKGKPVRQDWRNAEIKRGPCRRCGRQDAQLAHTVGKKYQDVKVSSLVRWVNPNSVIPLCGPFGWDCHGRYDRRETGIRDLLTFRELLNAGRACKKHGLDLRRRIEGGRV